MKKNAALSQSTSQYICRKCNRDDFKKSMEFTKHLKNCKGPVSLTVLLPTPQARPNASVVATLTELSEKAGELKLSIDLAIKRLK